MLKQKLASLETEFLLSCSRVAIDSETLARIEIISRQKLNWEEIVKLGFFHGTAALIYQNINANDCLKKAVPNSVFVKLQGYYYANLSRTLRLWHAFCAIYDSFKTQNIELIPLKGIILGNLVYHNPALRPIFSDIDILIQREDLTAASKLLNQLGYQDVPCDQGYDKPFRKDSVLIELHWDLIIPWQNRIKTAELWQRSEYCLLDNRKIRMLSCEDTLLTLPIQLRYGLTALKLFRVCDMHELLCQKRDAIDWDYLLDKAKKYQIRGPLLFNFLLCQKFFFSPLPRDILKWLSGYSFKRNILLLILERKLNWFFDQELKFKEDPLREYFLKLLLVDHPADYFNILLRKLRSPQVPGPAE